MAKFERPKERKPRGRPSKKDSRGKGNFRGNSSRRDSNRNRNRDNVQMTKVTCSSCGCTCSVPFKPTSSKPVYCDDCFSKNNRGGPKPSNSNKNSTKDLEIINEKLNKIMKALKIK